MNDDDSHRCDFRSETVRGLVARSEPLRVLDTLVLLEGIVIGKCDRCGHRYYPAEVVKRAELVVQDPQRAAKLASIPVVAA